MKEVKVTVNNWKRKSNEDVLRTIINSLKSVLRSDAVEEEQAEVSFDDFKNSGVELKIEWK